MNEITPINDMKNTPLSQSSSNLGGIRTRVSKSNLAINDSQPEEKYQRQSLLNLNQSDPTQTLVSPIEGLSVMNDDPKQKHRTPEEEEEWLKQRAILKNLQGSFSRKISSSTVDLSRTNSDENLSGQSNSNSLRRTGSMKSLGDLRLGKERALSPPPSSAVLHHEKDLTKKSLSSNDAILVKSNPAVNRLKPRSNLSSSAVHISDPTTDNEDSTIPQPTETDPGLFSAFTSPDTNSLLKRSSQSKLNLLREKFQTFDRTSSDFALTTSQSHLDKTQLSSSTGNLRQLALNKTTLHSRGVSLSNDELSVHRQPSTEDVDPDAYKKWLVDSKKSLDKLTMGSHPSVNGTADESAAHAFQIRLRSMQQELDDVQQRLDKMTVDKEKYRQLFLTEEEKRVEYERRCKWVQACAAKVTEYLRALQTTREFTESISTKLSDILPKSEYREELRSFHKAWMDWLVRDWAHLMLNPRKDHEEIDPFLDRTFPVVHQDYLKQQKNTMNLIQELVGSHDTREKLQHQLEKQQTQLQYYQSTVQSLQADQNQLKEIMKERGHWEQEREAWQTKEREWTQERVNLKKAAEEWRGMCEWLQKSVASDKNLSVLTQSMATGGASKFSTEDGTKLPWNAVDPTAKQDVVLDRMLSVQKEIKQLKASIVKQGSIFHLGSQTSTTLSYRASMTDTLSISPVGSQTAVQEQCQTVHQQIHDVLRIMETLK